jgi:O-antigen/teichoic acid export membrane protein
MISTTARRRIWGTVAGNIFLRLVRVAEQLLLVPVFLAVWGAEQYGEWIALNSLGLFVALANFGIGQAGASDIVLGYSRGDQRQAARSFVTSMVLITLVIACGYGLLVAALNTFDLGSVLTVQSLGLSEARSVILIVTLSTLLGFYVEPLNGVISATMGQAVPSVLLAISKAVELIGAACALIVFSARPVTVAAVMLGATLLNLTTNMIVALLYAPWISLSLRDFDLGALQRTWKASLGFFALLVCVVVFASQLPRLIIFHYFGASVLAAFSVLVIYTRAARLLAQTVSQGAQVEIGRAFAHGQLGQVKNIIEAILGGAVGTAGLILAVEIVLAPIVIPIWTHGQVRFSWDVLAVLAAVAFAGAYFDAAMVGVAAINRVGSTALAYGAGLTVGLLGGTALLMILGPVGICIGLLLPEFSGAWAAIRELNNTVPSLGLRALPQSLWPSVLINSAPEES